MHVGTLRRELSSRTTRPARYSASPHLPPWLRCQIASRLFTTSPVGGSEVDPGSICNPYF